MDKKVTYDASLDSKMDERSKIEYIRDNKTELLVGDKQVGKILQYTYKILIRDQPTLEGTLTREEMDLIYNLYSVEGSNLTQRSVSRYFPHLVLRDFKRILKAFNITKASAPMAPHVLEEKTTDELIELTLNHKENDYLRKLEQERTRLTEVRLKEMTKSYYELKNKQSEMKDFISNLKFNVNIKQNTTIPINDKTIIVYLSDMHIGAEVSDYSIYFNPFNKEVAENRMEKILNYIYTLKETINASNIVVCNLGDSLDGYNAQTTRGGHTLPQNMNNKDQYKTYIQLMIDLFASLSNEFASVKFYCVEGGNHDGNFGFIANKSLEACLMIMNPSIEVVIFDQFIDYFTLGNHTWILCHGKDDKDMFKNMPLTINDKTENYLNEFIDSRNLNGTIHFVKGDLHESATTYARRFRYKSVGSFFGSSEWIHKNFGNTKACCDIDVLVGDNIIESKIILN